METKNIYLSGIGTINSYTEDDNFLHIEGYGAHFNRANLNQERVDANSFNQFFTMYNEGKLTPILNWNHDSNQVIGTIDTITSDETGLFFKASINRGVKFCDENLIPNITAGVINSFSTEGYIGGGYDGIVEYEDGSYYVKNFILTALAVVSTPADWDAKFGIANYLKEMKEEQKSKWYLLF